MGSELCGLCGEVSVCGLYVLNIWHGPVEGGLDVQDEVVVMEVMASPTHFRLSSYSASHRRRVSKHFVVSALMKTHF